ncbi:MAG: DUF2062 domain-containing protein [Candidatus Acidiferrum sp.]
MIPNMMEERTLRVETADRVHDRVFRRHFARPIMELLRQGVTPEKLALSLALGTALGVFPVLGTTTALCAIAALILRLNLPAIQLVNYFVYPAQLALLIPFFRLGETLFGAPHLPLSPAQISAMFHANWWAATQFLWTTVWHAAIAWCLLAPLLVALFYVGSVVLLRRAMSREHTA